MEKDIVDSNTNNSHNPYFNRWFSAINLKIPFSGNSENVTILILIDGFLQSKFKEECSSLESVTILILIDGFLQYGVVFVVLGFVKVTILILIDGFLQ